MAAALSRDGSTIVRCGAGPSILANDLRTGGLQDRIRDFADAGHCATAFDLSQDGRWVFAVSERTDLVASDQNGAFDLFAFNRDQDGDGIFSYWETQFGLDPANASDATADADADGLTNLQEFQRAAHPRGFHRRYLAEGSANAFFSTEIGLFNPTAAAAMVLVTHVSEGGRAPFAPVSITYDVAPNSRYSIDVNAQPGLAATEVGAMLTSDLPILAERSQYFSRPGEFWSAGHAGAAVPAPATQWFVAEGATGFFQTYLVIANPGDTDAALTVAYLLSDGTKIEKPYTAKKASRLTIDVVGEDPRLVGTTMSMSVTSTNSVPVIVERVMWWPAGAPHEAAVSAGTTETATDWAAAMAPVSGVYGIKSYLLIANPTDQPGSVTIRAWHVASPTPPCRTTQQLLPHSRLTVDVQSICDFGGGTGSATITVRSDCPGIVVERATYRDVLRRDNGKVTLEQFWGAGEAVPLTKIAPLPQ